MESALVMPLMVFFTLGIIQLAMVQQARLMTEYAAFQAARAGVVWNGSNERMHDAAVIALLPTMGRSDDMAELYDTWQRHNVTDAMLQSQGWGVPKTQVNGQSLTGQIRIDTITPSSRINPFVYWNSIIPNEIDFDGVGQFPESPVLESHIAKFFNLAQPDPPEDLYRASTLLQIRLRYWYEMRIPFANQVIFLAWYAANADVALYGAIDRSSTTKENMLGKSGDSSSLGAKGRGIWDPSAKGFTPVLAQEMRVVWALASNAGNRRFFFPLQATHSMRMQSNFYRKWRVH